MKFFSTSLLTCAAVLISCGAWIGGISWGIIHLLNLSGADGWTVVGGLSALTVAAGLLLRQEVLHAIELPDDVDLDYAPSHAGLSYGERQSHSPVLPVDAAPAFRVSGRLY